MTTQEESKILKSQRIRSWIQGVGFPLIVGLVLFFFNKFDGYFKSIDESIDDLKAEDIRKDFKDMQQDHRLDYLEGEKIEEGIDRRTEEGKLYSEDEIKDIVRKSYKEYRDSVNIKK